jgi:hypothetical protein
MRVSTEERRRGLANSRRQLLQRLVPPWWQGVLSPLQLMSLRQSMPRLMLRGMLQLLRMPLLPLQSPLLLFPLKKQGVAWTRAVPL